MNKNQKEVVLHNGSLVNIAGPGSGKTYTLIEKIFYILKTTDTNINEILVLTFTNAAANEIRERLLLKFSNENIKINGQYYFGTYHSTFKRILNDYRIFERIGFRKNITISLPNDLDRYFSNIVKNNFNMKYLISRAIDNYYLTIDKKPPKIKKLTKKIMNKELIVSTEILKIFESQINNLRFENIQSHESILNTYKYLIEKTIENIDEILSSGNMKSIENIFGNTIYSEIINNNQFKLDLYKKIEEFLYLFVMQKFNDNSISFNDILLITLYSLSKYENIKKDISEQFKYIFVDEFQDTNIIEAEILLLLNNNNHICVIGDPYQSIYSFLGAEIKNLLEAKSSYQAGLKQLNINYRSNENIVNLTNYMSDIMSEKIDNLKPCISGNNLVKNNKITLKTRMDEMEQSKYIVNEINKLPVNKKIAIINRNGNTYITESFLNQSKIEYKKVGGLSITEAIEVQIFVHLINYTLFDKKYFSLINILKYFNGIGTKSIEDLEIMYNEYINDNNKEFIIKNKKILDIVNEIKNLTSGDYQNDIKKINEFYFEKIFKNISKDWKSSRIEEAINRIKVITEDILELNNIQELLEYLDNLTLDKNKKNDNTRVTITTIHSAKGLEWDVVFLLNWDAEIFKRDKYTEAQRLAYVSISRAKEKLYILSPSDLFFNINNDFIDANKEMFDYEKNNKTIGVINFGKHKGKKINELPYGYLKWLYENKNDFSHLLSNEEFNLIEDLITY